MYCSHYKVNNTFKSKVIIIPVTLTPVDLFFLRMIATFDIPYASIWILQCYFFPGDAS